MKPIVFQVSAKTARLIGRENISDVDGAIIELIKNGYDADAECIFIKFFNPFNEVPRTLSYYEVENYFRENIELVRQNYSIRNGIYVLNTDNVDFISLESYLRSVSKIVVIDNGSGMNKEVLESAWMSIGTDNKEKNIYSKKKNRIKTGAKGIGRFALDKLSLRSQVYTKSDNDKLYKWEIDWTQFDNVKMLNQVEAELNEYKEGFIDIVKANLLDEEYELIKNYKWDTGTAIILNPIREFWDTKLFKKVNNNLKNINPFGNVDIFNIYVRNYRYPDMNFDSENFGISRENYDYLIEAIYDGKGNITVSLDRNEIDIQKEIIQILYSQTDIEKYNLNEFWDRDAFLVDKYRRDDFDGKINFCYSLNEILEKPRDSLDKYKSVGPFCLKMYYLKNQKSTVQLVKEFKSRKRKQLLDDFVGIKIYRDNFKVRPYGDEGQFFDWINLSNRVQKSPAAASHESGNWRVSPNQLIGSVSISRIDNPKLEDTANREGMNLNREYDCFVEIIQGIISKFEYDRQYALREYAIWERSKKKAHDDKAQQIYEQVMLERNDKKVENKNNKDNLKEIEKTQKVFSEEDLKDAIVTLGKKNENKTSTEQLMMVLSSAGVMAQTFSHEITRMGTEFGSRSQHLKESINRLLNFEPYSGDEDFNPYDLLEELDSTDELLTEWVSLIMDSVKKENFEVQLVDLKDFLLHIEKLWNPLLEKKYIKMEIVKFDDNIHIFLPIIDLHLILNNFILNSAYYLEEAEGERHIFFSAYEDDHKVYFEMSNNGPELDDRYLQNPDETLNARETTKKDGTGLGLWIAREAAIRNSGELHVVPQKGGYMLRSIWIK